MNYDLFQTINNWSGHYKWLDETMIFFSDKALLLYAIGLALLWVASSSAGKRTALFAGITGGVGLLLNFLISLVYFEPRPFISHSVNLLIPHAADASFPSDHTTGAFCIALAIFLRNQKIGTPFLLLAIATGFSRIFVGHHYPGDVLASVIVGLVTSLIILRIQHKLEPIFKGTLYLYEKGTARFGGSQTRKS